MSSLDVVQRRMLRKIVGWTRLENEPWDDTMRRMNLKVNNALATHPMENWSVQLLRRQYRLAHRVGVMTDSWPARIARWHPPATFPGSGRPRGRPTVRWDDHLRKFSSDYFDTEWYDASLTKVFHKHEEDFVRFTLRLQQ